MAKEIVNSQAQQTIPSNGRRRVVEEILTSVWAAVLGQPVIGRHANFFEIGGDSLKAMEVISRVREVLQADLPLISFFEDPTINHLAEVLAGGRTDLEDTLAGIWAEVLGLQNVDKAANFFEIGGDSLKAMEVIARVSDVLHVDLPLIAFFEEPTVRHLADVLSAGQGDTAGQLADIWGAVLGRAHVEETANFFDIGGDSLKAVEVIARVSEFMRVDLPLLSFFEEPTVKHLAAVIDELRSAGTTPPITRVTGQREFPLSYSQQVWWLLEQQNPGTGLYNKPRIFRIHGDVDRDVMERSLNELRQRHEVLRARIVPGVNGPAQMVEQDGAIDFSFSDLSHLGETAREQMAMKLALETVRKPLDLANGQVQRAQLIRFSDDEFLLCISEHHIVNDGFTGSILLDELGAIYDAFAAGEPNPLAPPALHYTDYAAWEQRWMQGLRLADEVEYWRTALQNAPRQIALPTDFAVTHDPARRGNLRSRMVSPELLQRLQLFAQANGTTQFVVTSAALRLLLYRWSEQTDFMIATTASNRSRSGTERMPGPFVNPLPLRNAVNPGETALQLLGREKKAILEAFAHQDCPFAKIVEAVNPERTSDDNPLSNVGLVMENFPEIELKGRNFDAEYLNFDPEVSLLDLRFVAIEKHGGLRLSCEYRSGLFLPETPDALLHAYEDVLAAIIDAPQKTLAEFDLPEALKRQAERSSIRRQHAVSIAATYTAEPIQEPLQFWLRQLGLPEKIEFALFNQVFQQLLDPSSLFAKNAQGANVVLVRLEDLGTDTASIDFGVSQLVEAVRASAKISPAPLFLLVGPASKAVQASRHLSESIANAELTLVSACREIKGVSVTTSHEILRCYPLADYNDEYGYAISHAPYKPAMFTALATMIARHLYSTKRTATELIIVDASILWSKDGSSLDAGHVALQEFMLAQEETGIILALCSDESEIDVAAKFGSTPEIRLGWHGFAGARFGMTAKSRAVRELAAEMGLEVAACVFVTADPIDARELRTNCPAVTVAELPADAAAVSGFLQNFWAFDRCVPVASPCEVPLRSELLNRIARQLSTVETITRAMESTKTKKARVSEAYAPPRSAEEEFLADVWSRLLRAERPSIHDNFFALGGHSLMAAQVIARVRQTLGVELPLRAMFEAPTIAQFSEVIEAERRARTGVLVPPMTRVKREAELPLSLAQQRLWFIDQLEPGNPLYNIPQMYRLRGALQTEALQDALREIVRRHESLRTSFRNVDGQPAQVIHADIRLDLRFLVISGATTEEREAEVRKLQKQEALQPFDLTTAPLIRASLLQVDAEDHVLLVTIHHIVGDGWSGNLIAAEIAGLYEAFAHGQPSPFPELEFQYVDFASWQREWVQGELLESQVDYWREQLAGAPAVLALPTDRPRAAVQSHRGDIRTHLIPRKLIDKILDLTHAEGATLFMTLLACFQILLSRYSGQEDIVVGSPIAGRNYAEIEPLIGFFVNTLALRTRLSDDPTFRELLARVRQVALDAYAHQDIPFEAVVEDLQPERSLSYNPIFQVMFALQNVPKQAFELSSLRVERTSLHQQTSVFDMSWFGFELADGLLLRVEYDAELFEGDTILRAIEHYEKLLEAIAARPDSRISELSLLSDQEEQRILVEFNQTSVDYAKTEVIHDFVARHAARTPDATAIVFGNQRLTYSELNDRSNRIAHLLRRRGVGPDVLVGVYMERIPEMVVVILGILKAGGAYVPVDTNYPKERVAYILQEAKAPVVVTQRSLAVSLPGMDGVAIVCTDASDSGIERELATNPVVPVAPENLAYVLFTSGSTGRPKGVALTHANGVNFIHWCLTALSLEELSGVVFATSICFDMSTFDMFVTIAAGGKMILVENPLYLPSAEARDEVTLINTVPSAIAELVRIQGVPASLKTVVLAGEALPPSLVDEIAAHTSVERIWNLYGPTESGYATGTLVSPGKKITIGKPIANIQGYILDTRLRPVPIGVSGELYLAGAGLAQGYYRRDDLTRDRFITNPFAVGERMYKTGDLCRWLADGNIEYLGRIDQQVKIRGFRIELGEIESVLNSYPGVQQSVVLAREDVQGQKQLVAYLAQAEGQSLAVDELKAHVKRSLPDYMVPGAFVSLPALPLNPNGKIDRKALPAPDRMGTQTAEGRAPLTEIEEIVAATWADVLRLPSVGADQDFFDLGGHSLLATQVVSRVWQALGVALPLRAMFEAPTVERLARRVESLMRSGSAEATPPLMALARTGPIPLSFSQQRLWFLDQLNPNTSTFNLPYTMRVTGPLDIEALRAAFEAVVARHEALRTLFESRDGEPVQVILAQGTFQLNVVDLSATPPDQRETEWRRLAQVEIDRPFDLSRGPLLRPTVLRLAAEDHVLVIVMHHIISDRWSTGVMNRELTAFYNARVKGTTPEVPELRVQYADYAAWQRDCLRGQVLESQLSYWKEELSGAPQVIELPIQRPRPLSARSTGATVSLLLPAELVRTLETLARHERATMFMLLLAGFQALLARYCGQDDLIVGTPIANRNRTETEKLVGLFVNTLPLRGRLHGDPSFSEFLARVRATTLAGYANQDLPFDRLVEELHPERSLAHDPVVQINFALQNAPVEESPDLEGLSLTRQFMPTSTAKGDMFLSIGSADGGLRVRAEYNSDLFDAASIDRMLRHYQVLLEGVAAQPELRISQLPLLTKEERHQIVVEWNDTSADYSREACVHELFEKWATSNPTGLAVTGQDRHMTYGELNRRANQLARFLAGLGVGPGTLVAICVDRSIDMIVGILGILKAGGAYLPLDPSYPTDRLAFMLEDAQVPVLLTETKFLSKLPVRQTAICLDQDWPRVETEPGTNLSRKANSGSLAYVIYTSGSTGKPKGVQIEHRNLVNFLTSMQAKPGLHADDTLLAVTTLSFDIAGLELYLPLLCGAQVVLATREEAADGEQLRRLLKESHATVMQATPTSWRLLVEAGWPGDEDFKILCGGEALPPDLANQLLPRCGELWNMYGPTETTIWSSVYRVERELLQATSIGRPIANTTMYVLDPQGQPTPIGVPGELYIGGDGVARGYLDRPQLTAERFLADPFRAGERLYRTGDLAYFLPDGNVQFLGRTDFQVKIRGFRIELGEIETVLSRHDSLQDCAVIAREDVPGDKRLVAYVVPASVSRLDFAELRQWVKERVPEYMVPVAWVEMARLPLTPNGKVDRKNLPLPEYERPELASGYQQPRTPTEEVIAGIWAEVLKLERVGVHDQFFELGGHSLLATQVVSRIRQAFAVELPLRVLFEAPTVAALAQAVELRQRTQRGLVATPIERVPRDQRLPLSFAQQRLWVLDQIEPNNRLYNVPRPLHLTGSVNVPALEKALQDIVARHEVLRTNYVAEDGGPPYQVIAEDRRHPLRTVDLSALPLAEREKERRRMVEEEASIPFDLARDPMVRYVLFSIDEKDHILLITTHHIADDGWSTAIFLRELKKLYEAGIEGKPSPLPELPLQYADYAVWQRNWLQGEVLEQQLSYWRRKLDDAPPVLLVPSDRPRLGKPTFRGAIHRFVLPPNLLESVRSLSRQQGATAFMTMLSGFNTLLLYYTNQPDIVVGTDLANRTTVQTEVLIGFFVNLLAVRTDLSGDPTFAELLARVREVTLGAYAHQDVPFDKLVEELQPERSLSHNPIVQVLFVQQNTPRSAEPMPGLSLSWFPMEVPSKFDMAVFFAEADEGVTGSWVYSTDLFDVATIARMAGLFQLVLEKATARPTMRLSELLAVLAEEDQQHRAAQHKEFQEAGSQRLKKIKRKLVT